MAALISGRSVYSPVTSLKSWRVATAKAYAELPSTAVGIPTGAPLGNLGNSEYRGLKIETLTNIKKVQSSVNGTFLKAAAEAPSGVRL